MKKNQIYAALVFLGIAFFQVTLYLSSCQKKPSLEKVASSKIELFSKQFEAVNILDSKNTPPKNLQLPSEDEILTQNSLYADLVNNSFETLLLQIQSELTGDIRKVNPEVSTLIIYSNAGTNLTTPQQISAISTLTHTKDKLEHRLYKVENGKTIEMKKFYVLTDFINHGDIRQTLLLVTKNNNAGWIMVSNFPKIQSLKKQNKMKGFDAYSQILLNDPSLVQPPTAKGCMAGVVCGSDTTSHCQYDATWYCFGGCLVMTIDDSLKFYNYYVENDSLSLNRAYSFRNNFMSSYSIGTKYKGYYNTLSETGKVYNVVKYSTLSDWFIFTQKVYSIADKLQNGNNSDIIVDLDFKNSAISKINYFRTLNNTTKLHSILNDIENDLNYFYNKTRGQILSEIQ
jgi:hypothetical protein